MKENASCLFTFHPHGILCCGWSLCGSMSLELSKANIYFMGTDVLFSLPLISDMLTWYHSGAANKENMIARMKKGENLALLPGGFEEATIFAYGKHRVYIKRRAGFIKYALQHGYKILPTYTFGEEYTYYNISSFLKLRMYFNTFKLPGVAFFGQWFAPFMPLGDAELTTVVGTPLQLPTIQNPSKEDVALWHGKVGKGAGERGREERGRESSEASAPACCQCVCCVRRCLVYDVYHIY